MQFTSKGICGIVLFHLNGFIMEDLGFKVGPFDLVWKFQFIESLLKLDINYLLMTKISHLCDRLMHVIKSNCSTFMQMTESGA